MARPKKSLTVNPNEIKLFSYQRDVYKDTSRFKIVNKSRRIGFSFLLAFMAFIGCLNGRNQIIASASKRQSEKVMKEVKKLVTANKKRIGFDLDENNKSVISWNGSEIHCVPSNPETIRGFEGDVLIDEYAIHQRDRDIYESLLPTIVHPYVDYKIVIVSTPLGQSNMFHEIFSNEEKYPDWARYQYDIYQAIKLGNPIDIDIIKRNFDDESFRQEFLCEFIDDVTSYFPYELIKSNYVSSYPTEIDNEIYIGIDIGRKNDRSSIVVLLKTNGVCYLKQVEVLDKADFDTQYNVICQYIKDWNPKKVLIDKTGIGLQLGESLEKKYPNTVEGIHFTNEFKNDMVTYTKRSLEQHSVQISVENDYTRDLTNQLHSIKRTITNNNNTVFEIKRDSSGHGDIAVGFMLALYASKQEVYERQLWLI